jgi:hypothetical protein
MAEEPEEPDAGEGAPSARGKNPENLEFWKAARRVIERMEIEFDKALLVLHPAAITASVMRRVLAVLGSALFLVIAPGIVVGLVPWWISKWNVQESVLRLPFKRALGVLLILAGEVAPLWRTEILGATE